MKNMKKKSVIIIAAAVILAVLMAAFNAISPETNTPPETSPSESDLEIENNETQKIEENNEGQSENAPEKSREPVKESTPAERSERTANPSDAASYSEDDFPPETATED